MSDHGRRVVVVTNLLVTNSTFHLKNKYKHVSRNPAAARCIRQTHTPESTLVGEIMSKYSHVGENFLLGPGSIAGLQNSPEALHKGAKRLSALGGLECRHDVTRWSYAATLTLRHNATPGSEGPFFVLQNSKQSLQKYVNLQRFSSHK